MSIPIYHQTQGSIPIFHQTQEYIPIDHQTQRSILIDHKTQGFIPIDHQTQRSICRLPNSGAHTLRSQEHRVHPSRSHDQGVYIVSQTQESILYSLGPQTRGSIPVDPKTQDHELVSLNDKNLQNPDLNKTFLYHIYLLYTIH